MRVLCLQIVPPLYIQNLQGSIMQTCGINLANRILLWSGEKVLELERVVRSPTCYRTIITVQAIN